MGNEILAGKLKDEDALELRAVLQTEKEKGNHFAGVPIAKEHLTKEDFTFHTSVMDAWKEVAQKIADPAKYIFRSIVLLEDEVNKQLDGKKENELDLRSAFAQALSDKMGRADWHWENSDDFRTWNKGLQETLGIQEDLKLLARLDGGLEEAQKLWEQHVPAHSVAAPEFFSKPEQLHSIMGGLIMKEDATAVLGILEDHDRKGHRFVAFDNDPLMLPAIRFSGFRHLAEASEFALENSTQEATYSARSVAELKNEIQQVLDPTRAHVMKNVAERLSQLQPEDKRSRGTELSR